MYYLCKRNKKQIKYFMIMKTMYLIEHYTINRKTVYGRLQVIRALTTARKTLL